MNFKTNEAAKQIIKDSEGLRLKPYLCPAAKPTIGYGACFYANGKAVTMQDPAISKEEAEALLTHHLVVFENHVKSLVKATLNVNQFSALVSFVFNIGPGNFKSSSMLRLLNGFRLDDAAKEFDKWVNAAGKPLPGLIVRRKRERELFMKAV